VIGRWPSHPASPQLAEPGHPCHAYTNNGRHIVSAEGIEQLDAMAD